MANPSVIEMLVSPVVLSIFLAFSTMSASIPADVVIVDDHECDLFTGEILSQEIWTGTFSTSYVFNVEGERTHGGQENGWWVNWDGRITGTQQDQYRYPAGSFVKNRQICPTVGVFSSVEAFGTGMMIALFD